MDTCKICLWMTKCCICMINEVFLPSSPLGACHPLRCSSEDLPTLEGKMHVLCVFCSSLKSDQDGRCVCVCEYWCECVSLFISHLFLQIGTGFKDEDLEQHYKFLKVRDCSDRPGQKPSSHLMLSSFLWLLFCKSKPEVGA